MITSKDLVVFASSHRCAIIVFQKIEVLEHLKSLKRLFLYDNKIKKIENLDHLTRLETLWLNINYIKEIEVCVYTCMNCFQSVDFLDQPAWLVFSHH